MIKWLFRVLPIIYMIAIWMMSSHSSDAIVELPNSEWDGYIKESLHLVEFGLLYLFLALALLTMRELNGGINMILILISCLYGLTDEIHQSFVPYRTATVIDLVKDCVGVLVASWILYGAYQEKRFPRICKLLRKLENGRNETV
jgi:VanZ family protein